MSGVSGQLRESGRAFGDVFRNRGLRRVNLALAGSVIGDWAYGLAVAIWAYQQGGATALGIFGVVRYVCLAVFSPLLAALADRYPKQRVMIGADIARAALVVAAIATIAAGGPDVLVYGLALATAVAGLAFHPAQASLLPKLATNPAELTAANVVSSTIESVGFFLGPAVGGVLLAVTDIEVVYAFNAATFLWSAAMLVGLPATIDQTSAGTVDAGVGSVGASADGPGGLVAGLTAGFGAIARSRELRLIAGLYGAQTIIAGASLVYEVTIALELLEIGESGVGLLGSVLGVGGLVGGLVAMVLAQRQRIATDFGLGVVLWSAPLLLIVVSPTIAATLAAMFLIGIANSLVDINASTVIQRIAPADVLGRVFGALESIVIAGMALGALLMPVLIATVGLRTGLALLGAGVAGLAVAGLGPLRRIDATVLAPPSLALLRAVPTLAALPAPVLERLAQSVVSVTVPAGSAVFDEGDPGDRFWVIEHGRATVSIDGRPFRDLGPGDSFGEIALLRDVPRTATVRATDDDLVLQGLDRDDFIPAVTGHGAASDVADAVVDRWLTLG